MHSAHVSATPNKGGKHTHMTTTPREVTWTHTVAMAASAAGRKGCWRACDWLMNVVGGGKGKARSVMGLVGCGVSWRGCVRSRRSVRGVCPQSFRCTFWFFHTGISGLSANPRACASSGVSPFFRVLLTVGKHKGKWWECIWNHDILKP